MALTPPKQQKKETVPEIKTGSFLKKEAEREEAEKPKRKRKNSN